MLEVLFTGKEGMNDEEKQNAVNTHLEQMRKNYNGYKFGTTGGDGIYNTNLSLDYMQRLLKGGSLRLSNPNNKMSESVLTFIREHADSYLFLAELLESKQTSYMEIEENLRLRDLANADNGDLSFLKSFLFYCGALTFADRPGFLCIPNVVVAKTIVERVLQLCAIGKGSNAFKKAVEELIQKDKIDLLCAYFD